MKGSVKYSKIGDADRGIQVQMNWDIDGSNGNRGSITRSME
jgi:hypothetical protein